LGSPSKAVAQRGFELGQHPMTDKVAKALFARAEELFFTHPQVDMVEILAEKL